MVKHLSVIQETQIQFLGQEDPLEEVMATHSSIFAWRISMEKEAWKAIIHRVAKCQTQLKRLRMHTHDYIYL